MDLPDVGLRFEMTPLYFYECLERYLTSTYMSFRRVRIKGESYGLQRHWACFGFESGYYLLELYAVRWGEPVEKGIRLITMEMQRVGRNHTGVVANCCLPEETEVIDFYKELLRAIDRLPVPKDHVPLSETQAAIPRLEEVTESPMPTGDRDGETASPSLPEWFPQTSTARERWRRSYAVIVKKRKEYYNLYLDGKTDDPNPDIDDLRDAFADLPEWRKKPCRRTVRRIMQAGDNGWLKKA